MAKETKAANPAAAFLAIALLALFVDYSCLSL